MTREKASGRSLAAALEMHLLHCNGKQVCTVWYRYIEMNGVDFCFGRRSLKRMQALGEKWKTASRIQARM